jgi:penicillin-binding protein 1A
MFDLIRFINRFFEFLFELPAKLIRLPLAILVAILDIRFWIRVVLAIMGSVVLVMTLAYAAPVIWAPLGLKWFEPELNYFDQRSKGIGIYDASSDYLGIFDPRMEPDFNSTSKTIEWESFTAYPDHKSEHVDEVPPHYWSCLRYLEDRNLGRPLISLRPDFPYIQLGNLYGIDPNGLMRLPGKALLNVLGKSSGGGGSTISMQLARSYYASLPSQKESYLDKFKRKTSEWWLAPIIQRKLVQDGNYRPLQKWAANHLPLAQRVGGSLYGVGLTSRIIFGKPSSDMTQAEQFVLAAAVNRPIQVLASKNPRINKRRLRNWRHITAIRAQGCVNALVHDERKQKNLTITLQTMSLDVPQARLAPDKEAELQTLKRSSGVIRNNPVRRANHFAPSARFGARAEMVDLYGSEWRQYVARVDLTTNSAQNIRFREKVAKQLGKLNSKYRNKLDRRYTLDVLDSRSRKRVPDIIIAAADGNGKIVRYFEASHNAHYFGSSPARDKLTGRYERDREGRAIASVAKMIGAVLVANDGEDTLDSKYLDTDAPSRGLESCRRKGGNRRLRRAETVFACSMSQPLANRLFKLGQGTVRQSVDRFGFNMPFAKTKREETPPSTAVAHGLITGSPQKVHHLAAVILASLTGKGAGPVAMPTIIANHSRTTRRNEELSDVETTSDIIPDRVIEPAGRGMLRSLLSAPLCYEAKGKRHGTLKSQSKWCANRHKDILLHFAKTGTQTTQDADTTVDVWAAGGVQFTNGKSYSYVILVGSGSVGEPLGYRLHSSQLAAPLLGILMKDLHQLATPVQAAGTLRTENQTR